MTQAYTIYTARFKSGKELTATSKEYKNRLDFYNSICINRLGRKYGNLIEITCRPAHI